MSEQDLEDKPITVSRALERHLQTVLLSAVIALLMWNFNTVQKATLDLTALRAQTELMRADVTKLQASIERNTEERYTAAQAEASHASIDAKLEKLDERLRIIERAK